MIGRELTRKQVLDWNPDWSYTDLEIIEHHLDRLGARTFYVPPSGGYIGCKDVPSLDVRGRNVMTIHAGYVEFRMTLRPLTARNPGPGWGCLRFART